MKSNIPSASSDSAAPFARLKEPSELAYEIAGTIEHALLKPRLHAYTVTELAQLVEPDLAALRVKMEKLENAYAGAMQLALMNGAPEDALAEIARRLED